MRLHKILSAHLGTRILVSAIFAGGLSSCMLLSPNRATKVPLQSSRWIGDGSVVISRPVPLVAELSHEQMLGFIPAMAVHTGSWLSINRQKKSIELMEGDKAVLSTTAEGIDKIKPGEYHLMHKQTHPVWYAPDSYFSARKLTVPASADASRFRRGALGDFVLIFNKETPIHNAPIWSDDVGGVRMDDNDIAKIYYSLEVDAPVEVK